MTFHKLHKFSQILQAQLHDTTPQRLMPMTHTNEQSGHKRIQYST